MEFFVSLEIPVFIKSYPILVGHAALIDSNTSLFGSFLLLNV